MFSNINNRRPTQSIRHIDITFTSNTYYDTTNNLYVKYKIIKLCIQPMLPVGFLKSKVVNVCHVSSY